jgi:hypothetical protein
VVQRDVPEQTICTHQNYTVSFVAVGRFFSHPAWGLSFPELFQHLWVTRITCITHIAPLYVCGQRGTPFSPRMPNCRSLHLRQRHIFCSPCSVSANCTAAAKHCHEAASFAFRAVHYFQYLLAQIEEGAVLLQVGANNATTQHPRRAEHALALTPSCLVSFPFASL